MRRILIGSLAASALLFSAGFVTAQNTIDLLDRELKEAQQKHVDDANKILSALFAQIDAGMASPDAAIKVYTDPASIKGPLPPAAPVITVNEHESESEKEQREAVDQANLARFGAALQLHCGLLHFGGLMVMEPDRQGLQAAWVNWLKSAVPIYLQMAPARDRTAAAVTPDANLNDSQDHHDHHARQRSDSASYVPTDVQGKALRDSPFTKYYNYHGFDDKEQGGWAVRNIPQLYRANVLEPLRVHPTTATLAAWDNVIAMADADEPDTGKWNSDTNPELQFDRACDAYLVAPNTESLETLVVFIRQNPTYPKVDDWISKVRQFVADYRTSHTYKPPPVPAPTSTTPGVTVTSQQQGDMTIITTHSNGAPQNPAPPPR